MFVVDFDQASLGALHVFDCQVDVVFVVHVELHHEDVSDQSSHLSGAIQLPHRLGAVDLDETVGISNEEVPFEILARLEAGDFLSVRKGALADMVPELGDDECVLLVINVDDLIRVNEVSEYCRSALPRVRKLHLLDSTGLKF